jgi:hypothetical protein
MPKKTMFSSVQFSPVQLKIFPTRFIVPLPGNAPWHKMFQAQGKNFIFLCLVDRALNQV